MNYIEGKLVIGATYSEIRLLHAHIICEDCMRDIATKRHSWEDFVYFASVHKQCYVCEKYKSNVIRVTPIQENVTSYQETTE